MCIHRRENGRHNRRPDWAQPPFRAGTFHKARCHTVTGYIRDSIHLPRLSHSAPYLQDSHMQQHNCRLVGSVHLYRENRRHRYRANLRHIQARTHSKQTDSASLAYLLRRRRTRSTLARRSPHQYKSHQISNRRLKHINQHTYRAAFTIGLDRCLSNFTFDRGADFITERITHAWQALF